jgi:nitric oxide reductase subunit B
MSVTHVDGARRASPARKSYRELWIAFGVIVVGSFLVLLGTGHQIDSEKPPIPARVVVADDVLFTGDDIRDGQSTWQSLGGQEIGSVWGHGAYIAPDWTADWLHREATFVLDAWAGGEGADSFDHLDLETQAALRQRLETMMRTNTYDAATDTISLDRLRAEAFEANAAYYASVWGDGREAYAIPEDTLTDSGRQRDMASFFWWTSWAASTDRSGQDVSFTQNWPHEPLVGNTPPPGHLLWSLISIMLLLGGIAGMIWYFAARPMPEEDPAEIPVRDPLLGYRPTPSQRATLKYFFVVGGLLVFQILMGVVAAHYGVEGSGFYGLPLDDWLPYSVARTWHTQLGIFWIATAWLATGLFVAPAVGGQEPKHQRLLVNVLFGALLVVVVGSMAGEWLSAKQHLSDGSAWFWFGHQGQEYLDLGRVWQVGLFIGLFLWLFLVVRGLMPALRSGDSHQRSLLAMLVMSAAAIAGFYGASFGIWERTHLTMAEYWRWWVVHLWVEGFFEVFATVVIAFLFSRLGLIRPAHATRVALFGTVIFLSGGIIGTFHHLYFVGTPGSVTALGATFSALECVPLVLIGFEAWRYLRLVGVRDWIAGYKWAIYFFVAVAFWNMVGAGLFGFLINPPIALYYMQGLNTTPVHAHTALFGVYGMLGIGLMLFCVRGLMVGREWRDGPIRFGFWAINIGLFAMVTFSLLPIGLAQTWAAIDKGTWWARSAEFLDDGVLEALRWMRIPGDTIFALGALSIGWFMFGLLTGRSFRRNGAPLEPGTTATTDEPGRGPNLVGID